MNTQQYLDKVRKTTGYTDYRIGKDFGIQQTELSRYKLGKQTLTESNAFIFGEILNENPARIIADTKLENAIKKGNDKKISFWTHQVNRLKNGVASVFIFSFLALSPVDDVHANEDQTVTQVHHNVVSIMLFIATL